MPEWRQFRILLGLVLRFVRFIVRRGCQLVEQRLVIRFQLGLLERR